MESEELHGETGCSIPEPGPTALSRRVHPLGHSSKPSPLAVVLAHDLHGLPADAVIDSYDDRLDHRNRMRFFDDR